MAVAGAPSHFTDRPWPKTPLNLTDHNCINLRLPTQGGLDTWEFEKDVRELRVWVDGQLVFSTAALVLDAAVGGFDLASLTEQQVQPAFGCFCNMNWRRGHKLGLAGARAPAWRAGLLLLAVAVTLIGAPPVARSAGVRFVDVPADTAGPPLKGAVWSPCAGPTGTIDLGRGLTAPGTLACPLMGAKLPLVVVSHGYHGSFSSLHDVAETLADAGFVVAAINHPADSGPDMSHADELSALIERPSDIKRLNDFMLDDWPDRAELDPDRIGFLGFSRGGYTGLVLVGGEPDWHKLIAVCPQQFPVPYCNLGHGDPSAEAPVHDPRIKAAVIADPPFGPLFLPDGLQHVTIPVQLWASVYSGTAKTLDGVSPRNVAAVDRGLPAPHEFHVVENATHFAFLSPCRPQPNETVSAICLDAPGFDRVRFHRSFDDAVLAFFREHLPRTPAR